MLRTFYHPIHVAVIDPASPVKIIHRLPDHFRKITGVRVQHRGGIEQMTQPELEVTPIGGGTPVNTPHHLPGVVFSPGNLNLPQDSPVTGVDQTPVAGLPADYPSIARIGTAYLEINNQKTRIGSFDCSYEKGLGGCADFIETEEVIEPGTILTGSYTNELNYAFYQKAQGNQLTKVFANAYLVTIWLRVKAEFDDQRQRNLSSEYNR